MDTIELKKTLMHQIAEINDVSFLKAVKTILESKKKSEVIYLTADQRKEIEISKSEVGQGLYVENSILEKEITTWLDTK